jgi:uncharacterized protein YcbX
MPQLSDIYRYPVKGLSAERLERVTLAPGEGLPLDRAFALAHGSTAFDPGAPRPLPKTRFLMLMRNERLAALQTRYDEASGTLSIIRDGAEVARGDLGEAEGRAAIERFFAAYMAAEAEGAPRLVHAPGHSFADVGVPLVSLINLASLRALERVAGRPLHRLRFRANLYLEGAEPWAEWQWIGRELGLGGAVRLRVIERTVRCAATEVDPETAERDFDVRAALDAAYGHIDMGVYAEVAAGGEIAAADRVDVGPA